MSNTTTASSPDVAPVNEGDILDGKYRVERVLGVGGMGIVVAATHLQLDQRVALKFLLPTALGNAEVVARFAREARAAVRIQSEHVARVIDVGTLTTGSPYMVMEYLEGGDLSTTLETRGRLPVAEAVTYLLQACEAIAEAHSMGVVHRDLKPANLFLAQRTGRDPMVKVLDFGISKTSDGATSGLTQTSAVMGSPLYMSPEQMMSSRDVDLRTDIWSLGVILYELLVGQPPFSGDTMAQVVFMVTNRDAPLVSEKRADLPPGLVEIVRRCLRRDPSERYANVAELARALVPFGSSRADVSLERIARVLGTETAAHVPPPKPKSQRVLVAVALSLLIGGAALVYLLRSSEPPVAVPDQVNTVLPATPKPPAPPAVPLPPTVPMGLDAPVVEVPDVVAPVAPTEATPPAAVRPRAPSAKRARPREVEDVAPVAPVAPATKRRLHMEMK